MKPPSSDPPLLWRRHHLDLKVIAKTACDRVSSRPWHHLHLESGGWWRGLLHAPRDPVSVRSKKRRRKRRSFCSQDTAGGRTENFVARQKHKPQNDLRHPAAWCGLLRPPSKRAKAPRVGGFRMLIFTEDIRFSQKGDVKSDVGLRWQGLAGRGKGRCRTGMVVTSPP